jgi:Holliday junction DNA helicase RuvA
VASGGATSTVSDVREALTGLGYGSEEIREALRELPTDADSATLLRDALKSLGARRA